VFRSLPNEVNHDGRNDAGDGLIWLLVIIVLILAAAALVKYLRSGSKGGR
jgi:hypothetical protein